MTSHKLPVRERKPRAKAAFDCVKVCVRELFGPFAKLEPLDKPVLDDSSGIHGG